LALAVAVHGVGAAAARSYETKRLPHVTALVEKTTEQGRAAYGAGAAEKVWERAARVDALVASEDWPDVVTFGEDVRSRRLLGGPFGL
jgi:hypothetical protein